MGDDDKLACFRTEEDIVKALKSPLLQERLKAIYTEPSSFILQQNLDRDSDLRDFMSRCLETIGAVHFVEDESGSKVLQFDASAIVRKKAGAT